jgi:hypothetical protein
MIRALLNQEWWFEPEGQDDGPVTGFLLKCPTTVEQAKIDDSNMFFGASGGENVQAVEAKFLLGQRRLDGLRLGLKGWRNMFDADGAAELEFKKDSDGLASLESIDAIPGKFRNQIMKVLEGESTISEEESKNLE